MSKQLPFAVLNPGGRDALQSFSSGAGTPDDSGHPPTNYHAYAACTEGSFHRDISTIPKEVHGVLVLLRKRNLRKALNAVNRLKKDGKRVFVSLKESGLHQAADLFSDVTRIELFREICAAGDGYISSTPGLEAVYRSAGCKKGEFIPTPYPVEAPAWDLSQPFEKRRGIFVGTREFDVPTRRHFEAVVLADGLSRKLECPLVVINCEGRRAGMILKSLRKGNPFFYIVEAPMPYKQYLELMALHRIVWQLDASAVPGQVAGDALLCRLPCVGGNGAIEQVAHSETNGENRTPETLLGIAEKLLSDDDACRAAISASQKQALERAGFSVTSERVRELIS